MGGDIEAALATTWRQNLAGGTSTSTSGSKKTCLAEVLHIPSAHKLAAPFRLIVDCYLTRHHSSLLVGPCSLVGTILERVLTASATRSGRCSYCAFALRSKD